MFTIEQVIESIAGTGVVQDIAKFDPVQTFKENGVDSLDVFTIFLAVEEDLNVKFSEEDSIAIKSAAEMIEVLNSKK
jgi:acyl carrier protein